MRIIWKNLLILIVFIVINIFVMALLDATVFWTYVTGILIGMLSPSVFVFKD